MNDALFLLDILSDYFDEVFQGVDCPDCPLWERIVDALDQFYSQRDTQPAREIYLSLARKALPYRECIETSLDELERLTIEDVTANPENKRQRALFWLLLAKKLE